MRSCVSFLQVQINVGYKRKDLFCVIVVRLMHARAIWKKCVANRPIDFHHVHRGLLTTKTKEFGSRYNTKS